MDCQEITQPSVALEAMQVPEKKPLQEKLFRCIYSLFQGSFLSWILNKYSNSSKYKDKLWEDAKDAFQNGLSTFYLKAQQKDFTIKGNLKATIFSFGLFQLLAFFKKEKRVYGTSDYVKWFELFFEDDLLEQEQHVLLNEKEHCLMEALAMLPEKQQGILLMKFFHKLRSKQIAENLKVSSGNVDNESTKAYKTLRTILTSKFQIKPQQQWN